MVNRVAKGRRVANKLKQLLRKAGFEVAKTEYRVRYQKIDLFSLFDFLIVKPYYVAFVQSTTNQPHKHQPYLQFSSTYHFDVYQFVWYDRKGWVIHYYTNKHYKMDLRRKMVKFKIPYKIFTELSEVREFRKLYEEKVAKTIRYEFVDGDVVFEVEVSDEFISLLLNLPSKYREELFKYTIEK